VVGQLPRRAREPVEVGEPGDSLEGWSRRRARRATERSVPVPSTPAAWLLRRPL